MGIVYILTSPSGKQYVGVSQDDLETRWKNHLKKGSNCTLLKRAINKYGKESIKRELIIDVPGITIEELGILEQEYIIQYNTIAPNGYNCTSGGEINKKLSNETKNNIRMSMLKKVETNKEKFQGSIEKTKTGKYRAGKKKNGKKIYLGTWDTEEEARNAINIFEEKGENINIERNRLKEERSIYDIRPTTSKRFGAYTRNDENKSKRIYLGTWNTEEEAKKAIDVFINTGVKLHK